MSKTFKSAISNLEFSEKSKIEAKAIRGSIFRLIQKDYPQQ
jgi:hypothetical protein